MNESLPKVFVLQALFKSAASLRASPNHFRLLINPLSGQYAKETSICTLTRFFNEDQGGDRKTE